MRQRSRCSLRRHRSFSQACFAEIRKSQVFRPRKVPPPAQRVVLCLIGTEGFFFVALTKNAALPFIVPPPFFADFGHLNRDGLVAMR